MIYENKAPMKLDGKEKLQSDRCHALLFFIQMNEEINDDIYNEMELDE